MLPVTAALNLAVSHQPALLPNLPAWEDLPAGITTPAPKPAPVGFKVNSLCLPTPVNEQFLQQRMLHGCCTG